MTQQNGSQNGNESMVDDDYDFDDSHDQFQHPQQRNAANARERARMRVLSKAFCRLKTTLPWVPPDTKLSKLDTLRLATSYIAHLRAILKLSENDNIDHNIHPVNMNWPFNFNWEANPKQNEQLIKSDWSNYPAYNDKKYNPEVNYEAGDNFQCNRKYSINDRHPKMRQKNSLYFCHIESDHSVNPKCESTSSYKSYTYFG